MDVVHTEHHWAGGDTNPAPCGCSFIVVIPPLATLAKSVVAL